MFRLIRQLIKSYRNYSKVYIAVDLHGTVFRPTFDKRILATEYYPLAKKTLQLMSKRDDTNLIMWTASKTDHILSYNNMLWKDEIKIKYINQNPACRSVDYACFDEKWYFDCGLDDKCGFNPYIDWPLLYMYYKLKR